MLGVTLVIEQAVDGAAVRVAALADLHCTKTSQGAFQPLFARISESAEVLLLAGDLTDYGLPDEARVLARELSALRIPVAAVLGNHDLESGKADEVRQILNLPPDVQSYALMPVGYPKGKHGPISRKPVSEVACLDSYGKPWQG